jgi:7-cyano-7-deazaguanine synthase
MTAKAVVLVSGGLDSTTVLAMARGQGFRCHALSFDYGQRHQRELDAARQVADSLGVDEHRVIRFNLREMGGSALTTAAQVPKARTIEQIGAGIPSTYVPARNTIFLAFALGWAEVLEAWDIFMGANCVDYSGYPDCRPEYLAAFEQLANLATKASVEGSGRFRVHAPLLHWHKHEIIRRGLELGIDYGLTWSCYDPTSAGLACGTCDSCQLRREAFARVGMPDPIAYAPGTGEDFRKRGE